MTLPSSISRHGGLAATHELYADGFTRAQLTSAVLAGTIIRARQGWYARRDIHPTVLAAVRVGGRLTCLSALDLHGAWVLRDDRLHVAVAPDACRLRTPRDMRARLADAAHPQVRTHWGDSIDTGRLSLSPLRCAVDLLHCQPPELVAATLGSLLHEHPQLRARWRSFVAASPAQHRRWLERVDHVCESGTEGLFWFRMRGSTIPMRRQVPIPGVGRVDFVVGTRLVVEVDGEEYHTDPKQFEDDRRRDAALSRLGYRVLRFSYRQVIERWQEVEDAVLGAVLRGDAH